MPAQSYPDMNQPNDPPVVLAQPDERKLRIIPRHLTHESIEIAREYGDYANDPDLQRVEQRGGSIAGLVERERLRRWDNFVDEVAVTFVSRQAAQKFAQQMLDAINATWGDSAWRPR
jgi:hypothetical protein